MKRNFICETCGNLFRAEIQIGYTVRNCSSKCRKDSLIVSIIGKKINNLTIIREVNAKIFNRTSGKEVIRMVECKCDCGNICTMSACRIRIGKTKSCGCFKATTYKKNCNQTKHGLHRHPLNNIWVGMKQRCYNKKNEAYPNYGGKGVVVCDEWLNNLSSFYNWAINNGWKSGLEIDKDIKAKQMGVDPLIYSPEMCSIVTRKINTNYRVNSVMVHLDGQELPLSLACDKLGLSHTKIYSRMQKNGFDFDSAIKKMTSGSKII